MSLRSETIHVEENYNFLNTDIWAGGMWGGVVSLWTFLLGVAIFLIIGSLRDSESLGFRTQGLKNVTSAKNLTMSRLFPKNGMKFPDCVRFSPRMYENRRQCHKMARKVVSIHFGIFSDRPRHDVFFKSVCFLFNVGISEYVRPTMSGFFRQFSGFPDNVRKCPDNVRQCPKRSCRDMLLHFPTDRGVRFYWNVCVCFLCKLYILEHVSKVPGQNAITPTLSGFFPTISGVVMTMSRSSPTISSFSPAMSDKSNSVRKCPKRSCRDKFRHFPIVRGVRF